jgi:DNA-directed RNA polymerases I, II, and III subunit RPABC1
MNSKEDIARSLKTIIEMLQDRKIHIENSTATLEHILDSNQNRNVFDVIFDDIRVVYYLTPKIKYADLAKALEGEGNNGDYRLILLVVAEKLSTSNLKSIAGLGLPIQIWNIKELQYNITKHVLVPKHEPIVDEQEIKSIVERYSLKSKYQLPHILKTDAMSKYLGLRSGDVVKITRASPTSGEYIFYRCCL